MNLSFKGHHQHVLDVNDNGRLRVDVVCSDGFVKQEASYYATLDDIANVVGKENVFLASPAFA